MRLTSDLRVEDEVGSMNGCEYFVEISNGQDSLTDRDISDKNEAKYEFGRNVTVEVMKWLEVKIELS